MSEGGAGAGGGLGGLFLSEVLDESLVVEEEVVVFGGSGVGVGVGGLVGFKAGFGAGFGNIGGGTTIIV